MDKSKMVLRISIVLCLSLLFVSCDVESSVSISSEKESSSELDSSESSSAPISSSTEEPIARRLKVGEYFTDIEYQQTILTKDFKDYTIASDQAIDIIVDTLKKNGALSKDDHVFFRCIKGVVIDELTYYYICEYSENNEIPAHTSVIDFFYVDVETGSVFLKGNMNKEDDGRDILIKLK